MATYMIWEGFMDKIESKMKTVEKKCRKYGVEFTFRLTGNEEFRTFGQKNDDGTIEEINLRYVEVEAEGKAQINGWEWLAIVERTENGNLIRSARDVTVPIKYYTSDCYCEHCKTHRWRKYVHLVRNVETGDIKQVGSGCLKDYTHGMSADGIAFYQSLFTGLEEAEEQQPSIGMGGWGVREWYDVEEITRYMSETIRHFGFVPKGDETRQATAFRAMDIYDVINKRYSKFTYRMDDYYRIQKEIEQAGFNPKSPEAAKEAHDALEWIAVQDDSRSTYLHNLKLVCSMTEINRSHYGILASLLPTFNKSLIREAERKAEAEKTANSKYVGKVGDRLTIEVESTEIVTSWETDWGLVKLVRFISKDGNVFMWRCSCCIQIELDKIKTLTGTVKSHEEFRGVKQTFLSRCKVA